MQQRNNAQTASQFDKEGYGDGRRHDAVAEARWYEQTGRHRDFFIDTQGKRSTVLENGSSIRLV